MLSLMRRNAGSWIIKIILAVIVIVFASWGVGSYGEMRRNRVATVGKETITLKDFDATYRSMLQQLQANLGTGLNEDLLKAMALEKQALSQLINRQILLQAAAKMKLVVSDEELRNSIYSMPVFQNADGQFDPERYLAVMDGMQVSNDAFEEMQRQDLLMGKVMEVVMGSVKVSDAEVQEWYQHVNRRVAAKYVELDPAFYVVAVSDDEIKAYYDSHNDTYMSQPMRQVAYAKFSPTAYLSQIEVTDADVLEMYENNLEVYSTPALLDISQIVVAIEEPGKESSEAAAKARIDEVYAKLVDGADFAEMVKEYSAPSMQQNDGRAPNVPQRDFAAYFGEELANTAVGELTPPLKTDFAWYIFKFHDVKPEEVRAFDDIKDILKDDMVLNQARNLAYDDAEEVSAAAFAGEELVAAADAKGVKVVTTEYFDRGSLVNSLTLYQRAAFTDFVFTYDVGDVSEPHEFEGDYYVVSILDEKAPFLIPLEDVKVVVEQAVRAEKQLARAMADAQKITADVKSGQSIEEAAASFEFSVKSTGLVTRYDYIMDFDMPGSLAQETLFSLSETNPVINEPLPGPMVMVYEDSAPADESNFEEEATGIRMELLNQKREEVFARYMKDLRQKTKIGVADSFTQFYDPNMI